MKHLKSKLIVYILFFSLPKVFSQPGFNPMNSLMFSPGYDFKTRIAINSGDIKDLIPVKNVNIIYDYSTVSVDAFRTEEQYLNKIKDDCKADTLKFEKYRQSWFDSRKMYFEPEFERVFNARGKKNGISGKNYSTEHAVTLKVGTIFFETGKGGRYPSYIDVECTFLDGNGKEILRYFIKSAHGDDPYVVDIYPTEIFTSCYGEAARVLMKDITRHLKK